MCIRDSSYTTSKVRAAAASAAAAAAAAAAANIAAADAFADFEVGNLGPDSTSADSGPSRLRADSDADSKSSGI